MTALQKFFTTIMPASWAQSMESESRSWVMRCPCGQEQSVWDAGGIRWKATGNPKRRQHCTRCGQTEWQQLFKK